MILRQISLLFGLVIAVTQHRLPIWKSIPYLLFMSSFYGHWYISVWFNTYTAFLQV